MSSTRSDPGIARPHEPRRDPEGETAKAPDGGAPTGPRWRRRAVAAGGTALVVAAAFGLSQLGGEPARDAAENPDEFLVAADLGCLDDDACLGAFGPVYGIDLAPRQAVLPDGMQPTEAVDSGLADVAVLASAAEADQAGMVVLRDDLGLFTGDALVALGTRTSLERGGAYLQRAADEVLAALDDTTLRAMVAEVVDGAKPADVAAEWLPTADLPAPAAPADDASDGDGDSDSDGGSAADDTTSDDSSEDSYAEDDDPFGGTVRVGGTSTPRGKVLAAVTAAGLREQGFTVKVAKPAADPDALLAAVRAGDVTLGVEHLNPLLLSVTDSRRSITGDPVAGTQLLRDRLDRRDVAVLGPGVAVGGPVLATTADLAERLDVASWSDLAPYGEPARALPAVEPAPQADDITADLFVGDTGPAVALVQQRLVQVGHDPGRADGVFDEATRRAVAEFQRSQILPTSGAVGPLTRRRLEIPYGVEGERAAAAEAAGQANPMAGASE